MSITDELRKWWARKFPVIDKGWHEDFTAIADRIDAEHERELRETGEDIVQDVRHEWVRLPVDADGVPIHVGDLMDNTHKDGFRAKRVIGICQHPDERWTVEVDEGRLRWHDAAKLRHHHEPTVEDVLRDVVTLCHNTWKEGSAFEFYDVDDVMESGNIAEYIAKLRLAGDAE